MTVLSSSQTVSTASALEIKDLSSQHVKHTLCIPTPMTPLTLREQTHRGKAKLFRCGTFEVAMDPKRTRHQENTNVLGEQTITKTVKLPVPYHFDNEEGGAYTSKH
jgi:hypothetical protein